MHSAPPDATSGRLAGVTQLYLHKPIKNDEVANNLERGNS